MTFQKILARKVPMSVLFVCIVHAYDMSLTPASSLHATLILLGDWFPFPSQNLSQITSLINLSNVKLF